MHINFHHCLMSIFMLGREWLFTYWWEQAERCCPVVSHRQYTRMGLQGSQTHLKFLFKKGHIYNPLLLYKEEDNLFSMPVVNKTSNGFKLQWERFSLNTKQNLFYLQRLEDIAWRHLRVVFISKLEQKLRQTPVLNLELAELCTVQHIKHGKVPWHSPSRWAGQGFTQCCSTNINSYWAVGTASKHTFCFTLIPKKWEIH